MEMLKARKRGGCYNQEREGEMFGSPSIGTPWINDSECPCLPSVPLPPRGDGVSDFFSEAEQESRVVGCVVSIGKLSEVFGSEMRCEVG